MLLIQGTVLDQEVNHDHSQQALDTNWVPGTGLNKSFSIFSFNLYNKAGPISSHISEKKNLRQEREVMCLSCHSQKGPELGFQPESRVQVTPLRACV